MGRKSIVVLVLALGMMAPNPAYAAAYGTIKGHILDADSGKPRAHVLVALSGAKRDGTGLILRKTRTDAGGAYSFGHLPTGRDRFYALDAVYQKGTFAGRAISIPANTSTPPVIDTTLRVYPTIENPQAMLVSSDNIFVVPNDRGVGVIEAVHYSNQTNHAYIGRAMAAGGSNATRPSLGFSLPPQTQKQGVRIVRSSLDVPGIVPSDFGFSMTAAIPPGANSITFGYEILGDTADFSLNHTALYPTIRYQVFVADPLQVNSALLKRTGTVRIGGAKYTGYTSRTPLNAGDQMEATAVAEAGVNASLLAGIAGAGLLLIALIVWAGVRRKRSRSGAPVQAEAPAAGSRAALVEEIARLDLSYRAGRLDETEWETRRADLKGRLAGAPTLEGTP